jgi:hypothetical protein
MKSCQIVTEDELFAIIAASAPQPEPAAAPPPPEPVSFAAPAAPAAAASGSGAGAGAGAGAGGAGGGEASNATDREKRVDTAPLWAEKYARDHISETISPRSHLRDRGVQSLSARPDYD